MQGRTRRSVVAVVVLAALVAAAAAIAATSRVVATGLFNPRGISVAPGKVLVAQNPNGALVQLRGARNGADALATIPNASDVALTGNGWEAYATTGGTLPPDLPPPTATKLWHVTSSGKTDLVADIGAYQVGDPDPDDQDDFPEESNPNGLALLPGGQILVSDAANNDLLLVNAQGHITTVARFKRELVGWPAYLPFGPPDGTPTPAESVPTAVAVGPDGAYYVPELKGFPFAPGSSRIWRIEPGSVGATCDPTHPQTGPCRTVGTGYTSILDLTFGPDGTMYVLEMAKASVGVVLVLEQNPATTPGALYAVKDGVKTELVPGTLMVPGGVAIDAGGSAFVTTGDILGPGGGAVVRVEP
jgi:sugar lactone lactonase YvrE